MSRNNQIDNINMVFTLRMRRWRDAAISGAGPRREKKFV